MLSRSRSRRPLSQYLIFSENVSRSHRFLESAVFVRNKVFGSESSAIADVYYSLMCDHTECELLVFSVTPFKIDQNKKSKPFNCWFSHDVTKIQTKKLSILPRFYFHDALEQLKTNCQKIFPSKGFLVL